MSKSERIIKSGLLLLCTRGIFILGGFVAMIFLACWLAPGNYGLIAFATMLVATMGLFTDLGLFPSIARFVSDYTKAPTTLQAILSQGLTLKAAVLAVAMKVPIVLTTHQR